MEHGAPEPEIDLTGEGTECFAAVRTDICLDSLATAEAKDIYIVVKNIYSYESEKLKIEIDEFVRYGDVNRDRKTDAMDAALVLRYDAGLIDGIDFRLGDVNADGELDNLDASIILQIDAGVIEES